MPFQRGKNVIVGENFVPENFVRGLGGDPHALSYAVDSIDKVHSADHLRHTVFAQSLPTSLGGF
jgi:hypothetical protein